MRGNRERERDNGMQQQERKESMVKCSEVSRRNSGNVGRGESSYLQRAAATEATMMTIFGEGTKLASVHISSIAVVPME